MFLIINGEGDDAPAINIDAMEELCPNPDNPFNLIAKSTRDVKYEIKDTSLRDIVVARDNRGKSWFRAKWHIII